MYGSVIQTPNYIPKSPKILHQQRKIQKRQNPTSKKRKLHIFNFQHQWRNGYASIKMLLADC